MSKMHCCPNCFGDRGLAEDIIPSLNPGRGTCDYCGSKEVLLVEPAQLTTWFELLINAYEPDERGKPLVDWLKSDWMLFGHHRMDDAHSKELLGDIFDDGNIVRQHFAPSRSFTSEGLATWETLRDEMMYKNRWFLDVEIDNYRLRELLDLLIAPGLPEEWFRARITSDTKPLTIGDMGAPPNRKASHGRANPAGIPYLYVGSVPETAVAELRPNAGELVCVASFDIRKIRAVDLRDPRGLVSPFILTDASEISQLRADLPFLERLGEELTRPVLPSGAAIDYIPSQYLCEFIKKSGFDGVVYRSSVSEGFNLALFCPAKAQGKEVSLYTVKRVIVEVVRSH